MKWTVTPGTLVALMLVGAAPLAAQSLGEIARQEEARRKAIGTPDRKSVV